MRVDKKSLEKKYSTGVDLGGTNIVSAIVNYQGKIVNRLKVPTFAERGKEATIKRIIETIHENIVQSNIALDDIIGIGIGAPGPLDTKRGVINFAPNLPGWRDVPLKKILEVEFSMKVVLENDANAAAWGERCFGIGRGVDNLVCFTLGTGIGGGIIIDSKIYHGSNYGAAELGHMTVNKDGPRCNCGNYGCLEAYSSATGIKNRIKSRIKEGIKSDFLNFDSDDELLDSIRLKSIFETARKGDKLTKDIVEEAISYLGIAIANITNILNPGMVVLVGGITNEGDKLLIPLKEEVKKRAFYSNYKSLKIVIGELGGNAGVLGAAALLWIPANCSC
ncbi:MAG: ROK family protein [Atribacterota bacterium]